MQDFKMNMSRGLMEGYGNVSSWIENTTEGISDAPKYNPRAYKAGQLELLLDIYFYMIGVAQLTICCIGASTNILNIIALSKSAKVATYKILIAMAVADLLVMIVLGATSISVWIVRPSIILKLKVPSPDLPYSLYFWYNVWFHAANIFWLASAWCACILVIFRLIAISFPLKAQILASGKRVNGAICAVYVGSLLLQVFMWQRYRINGDGVFEIVLERSSISVVYTILAEPTPYLVCFICTIMLLIQLRRTRKQISSSMNQNQLKERSKEQKQLTRTLIMIVVLYVLTNTPTMIYFFMALTNTFEKKLIPRFDQNIFWLLAGLCSLVGYASNFFIYVLANPKFRKDLLQLFKRKE